MEIRKNTISVKPDNVRLPNLLQQITDGNISIPVFQRDFVWNTKQMVELFDSISKGFPIGSLLFWKPENTYQTFKTIGIYPVSKPKENNYVLDGFQRITTLFGVLTNPKNYNFLEKDLKDYLIYYNLSKMEFVSLKSKKDKSDYYVALYRVIDTFEYLDLLDEIKTKITDKATQINLINSAREINKVFLDYHIPFVEIKGGDISSAVQIFSRINSTGEKISEDFMLSALSYNENTGFLLSNSITTFINGLNPFNFEEIKRDTILNSISNATGRVYFDVKIEDLLDINPSLEKFTENVYIHLKLAISFLYKNLNVIDLRLLPYPTQLIFISEYFRLNPYPNEEQLQALEKWFWITSYSNYFTLYSLSQQRSAYQTFCEFANGSNKDGIFKLDNDNAFISAKYPDKVNFTGVRAKALQLFYLKSIRSTEIQERESFKDIFIVSKKDRTPGNIILRFASEFEKNYENKNINTFINNSPKDTLNSHFITEKIANLFKQGKIEDFIQEREKYIKFKEKEFVESLGIKYTE